MKGEHATFGPLWGYSTTTRVRLRLEVQPWFAIRTTLVDVASAAQVRLRYGGDSRLQLYLPIRLGSAVRVFPGAAVTGQVAHSTAESSTASETGWDWGGGWQATLAVSLGTRAALTVDAGYSRPWHATTYLGDERWTCGLTWSLCPTSRRCPSRT